MESANIFRKDSLSISHFPSALLLVGYIAYWVELYVIRMARGRTSLLAASVFMVYCLSLIWFRRSDLVASAGRLKKDLLHCSPREKILIGLLSLTVLVILGSLFQALLLPPHLCQEYDSLNYHLTIPKQHLILHSFKHIGWSSADLRLLPLDFAIAPYWFVGTLPSKLAQFAFVIGLVAVSVALARKLGAKSVVSEFAVIAAILGSHGIGIQMGTAMLDLPIAYLFIASIDSLLGKRYALFSVETAFFIFSKPFQPILIAGLVILLLLAVIIFRRFGFSRPTWAFTELGAQAAPSFSQGDIGRVLIYLCIAGLLIGGPFIIKSVYYCGTPLYPFLPGMISHPGINTSSAHWQSILYNAKISLSMSNAYGCGKGPLEFLKHFWLLAVPEKSVNNRFDYPMGLAYLLFLGPFMYFLIAELKKKRIALLPSLSVLYWLAWWSGSQQTRFLYAPLVLIFIVVCARFVKVSKVLLVCLFLALAFNAIALFRAHYSEFFLSPEQVLREEDKEFIRMNDGYFKSGRKDTVELMKFDAAYADFPIKVVPSTESQSIFWVLEEQEESK